MPFMSRKSNGTIGRGRGPLCGRALALLAAASMFPLATAAARDLAVPGRIPARAVAVVSITDPAGLWTSLSASPAYGPLQKLVNGALFDHGAAWSTFNADRAAIEDFVGYSMTAPAVFQEAVRGIDIYIAESSEAGKRPYTVMLARMGDAGQAQRTLELLLKEAKNSSGLAFGERADSISESKQEEQVVYSLRGLKLSLAVVESVLIVASDDEGAWAALDGKATVPLFESDAYRRSSVALDPLPGQMWMYGDASALAKLAATVTDAGTMVPANLPPRHMGILAEVRPDYIKLTQFTAPSELTPFETATTAATRGEASGFKAAALLPPDALVVQFANNFDGISALYGLRDTLVQQSGGLVSDQQFQSGVEGVNTALGFSLENDFLSSLGGDIALSLNSFTMTANAISGTPTFDADALFISTLADASRMETVMKQLETELTKQAEMFVAPGSDPSKKGEAAKGLFTTEKKDDATLTTVDLTNIFPPASQFSPTWAITKDGMYVLGLKKDGVVAALARKGASPAALFESAQMKAADKLLSPNRQQAMSINLRGGADLMGSIIGMAGGGSMKPSDREMLAASVDLVRTLGVYHESGTFTPEGVTREYLFLMK